MEKTRLGQAFDETLAASHRAVIAALEGKRRLGGLTGAVADRLIHWPPDWR